jgi:cystathionine beta-lyase
LDALQLFGLGYSWGGYESLALPVSLADRTTAKGPQSGTLIRLQIGLEDVDDLKKDLDRGFAAVAAL